MNEDQKESGHKWHKQTIVQWFFVVLVLCVIAGVIVMGVGGQYGPPGCGQGYLCYKGVKIPNAVRAYQDDNDGKLPVINATVNIGGHDFQIVDICALLTSGDSMLSDVPVGLASVNGSGNDNCDAGCEGCKSDYHYIWAVDDEGNVYSTCVGDECEANGEDGFQDVWP